jgi:hypothetical protein
MPIRPSIVVAASVLFLTQAISLTHAAGLTVNAHEAATAIDSMADLPRVVGHVRPDDEAKVSAVARSYTVTARAGGNPFYTRTVFVDSTGVVYQVSAGGNVSKEGQADALDITVPSAWPLMFTLDVRKAEGSKLAQAHGTYQVDVPEGGVATAALTKDLSVTIERAYDQVVLR